MNTDIHRNSATKNSFWRRELQAGNRRRVGRGFTLLELLVVIAIIGILAILIMGSMGYVMQRSETVRCIDSMRQVASALHSY